MSDLIEDKERHRAWVEYIKRRTPPTLDSAFDWAWFRQQSNIEKLQAENEQLKEELKTWEEMAESHAKAMVTLERDRDELQRKLDLAVEALGGLIHHCVDFNQGAESFVLAMEIEKADQALKEIKEMN